MYSFINESPSFLSCMVSWSPQCICPSIWQAPTEPYTICGDAQLDMDPRQCENTFHDIGWNLSFNFLVLFCLFALFWNRVSLYSAGRSGTTYVDQTNMELTEMTCLYRSKGVHNNIWHVKVSYQLYEIYNSTKTTNCWLCNMKGNLWIIMSW